MRGLRRGELARHEAQEHSLGDALGRGDREGRRLPKGWEHRHTMAAATSISRT